MKILYCFIIATTIMLTACGSDKEAPSENATTETSGNQTASLKPLNDFAKDLINEEGCDPRIANAMAPFESDYGECTMPQFVDVCGTENSEAGIALIGQAREQSSGLNPWVWACARRMETKTALVATCQYRLGQPAEVCECGVNASFEAEADKELLEWLTFTEANDPTSKQGKFKQWATFGDNGRWEELSELRARHYAKLEACMAS